MKVVLVGAGSAVFTKGLIADLIARGREATVGLVDPNPEALETARGLAERMISMKEAPLTVEASVDRREVLPGATAVICTVGVGGRKAWLQDVLIPRKYGIYQPVGDTVMPGGLSRALRMVPAMVEIAQDVHALCPDALFFNYGNPMAAVCRGIRKATDAQVIGLCHGVHHVAGHIARLLGVGESSLRYNAVGINHLTWFTEVRADGVDMMPRLFEIARGRLDAGGAAHSPAGGAAHSPADSPAEGADHPATWELLLTFGAFPAVLDRHICEFFPNLYSRSESYYGKTLGTDCYSLEATIAHGDAAFEEMKAIAAGESEVPQAFFRRSAGEHEQVVDIIDSIRNDSGAVYSANLPNRGQVPNLPADAIVEAPAVADGSGIRAIGQAPLPSGIAGALARPFAAVETVVDAALNGDRDAFVQALLIDGSVTGTAAAAALADELIAAHKPYLERFQ